MAGKIPNDPIMCLSFVNTQLRDFYPDLDELCSAFDTERWDIPMTEKRTSSARARSGFTLAELLIVTGIVSILVAVSIPIMSGQVQKAKEVRAKAEARILCMALWMYLHDLDEQDIHPESWELMMDLGGSFRDRGENPLENYLDGEISEDVSIYSVYYSDTLESYGGILCEIGGIEVEALTSGKTEIVNP